MSTNASALRVTPLRAGRIAGALLLATNATAIFSEIVVKGRLIVPSDATATARNLGANELLYRAALIADVTTLLGVAVLVWALYVMLRSVDRELALLATMIRTLEIAIALAGICGGLAALRFLAGTPYLDAFQPEQLHVLARVAIGVQGSALTLCFVLIGFGSALFAWLLFVSRMIPRAFAGFGVFASLLLASSSIAAILLPKAAPSFQFPAMLPMGVYEITLGALLLIRGPRL